MNIPHVLDMLDTAAESCRDDFFLRGTHPMTFGEVANASHRVAEWLSAQGLSLGDRLLIVTPNHAESIVIALGAARCGVTFSFLHPSLRPASFRRIVDQVGPSCLVLASNTAHLRAVVPALPLLTIGNTSIEGGVALGELLTAKPARRFESVLCDPFCLIYTSGSTAEPRGVMVSHANVVFTVSAIQNRLNYRAEDIIGLYLPLSFDYGFYQLLLALSARASVYVGAPDLVSLALADSLEAEEVTVLPAIPLLTAALAQMLERNPRALPHLRAVTNTGEQLPQATINRLRALFPRLDVFLMYGLTECKRVSILLPHELEDHPESVGRPLDGTSVEVVGSDGCAVPDGMPGELVVKGPHVTMGYWRNPYETARRFATAADGTRLLFTGDVCRRSADGFIYFEGRRDSQAKHRGFRISLQEIEATALEVNGAASAAAVASSKTDELHLFLTRQSSTLSESMVLRQLRERLEPYKIPDRIHLVASLPTTPTGKVDQQQLRVWAEELRR